MTWWWRLFVTFKDSPVLIPKTHRGSHLSITTVSGELMPSYVLHGYQECMWYIYTHSGKAPIDIK